MVMTKEEISENSRKIFTREYAALFDLLTKDIKENNQMDDTEKLIAAVGKVLTGHQAKVALAALSIHVLNVSRTVQITDAIDKIKMNMDVMVR